VQSRSKVLPAGFGTFDASDWDPNGHLNLFPAMEVTVPRSAKAGSLFYVAVHDEVGYVDL
jgi:hypothetical protein